MKKILIVLTAISIFASLADFSVFGADTEVNTNSEINDEYYGLISSISDAEEYLPYDSQTVTRGEFIEAFVSAMGFSKSIGKDISFSDVQSGTYLYDALSIAVGAGLIGDGDNFRQDDAIKINEALKICVCATGYGVYANRGGGYPDGYIATGTSLHLFDGITSSGVLSGKDAYKMIYNTLESDYLEYTNGSYEKGNDNVLYAYRNIKKIKGIVTSNSTAATGSISDSQISPMKLANTIGIDYVRYKTQTEEFDKYLGYSVTAYICDDGDDVYAVYLHPKRDNSEQTFKGKTFTFKDSKIELKKNEGKKYTISPGAEVIYNGRADYGYDLSNLEKVCGTVRIVDNNSDNKYDYVIIDDYYYMKVASFDKGDIVIRDTEDKDKEINLDDHYIKYSIYNDEEQAPAELGDIIQGSILAIRRSSDKLVVDIVIIGRILSGTVERSFNDSAIINNEEYTLSDYFLSSSQNGLGVGKYSDFYIGINDEIVALSYVESAMQYAYLIRTFDKSDEESSGIRLFNQKGKMLVLDLSEKVILDGTSLSAKNACARVNDKQLIRYGTDSDGKVKWIDTAVSISSYVDDTKPLDEYNHLVRQRFAASYYYRSAQFYPYFNIQDTIIFRIPKTVDDYDGYEIGYSFVDGTIADGDVEAYDVGLDGTAEALVVYADRDDANIDRVNPKIMLVEEAYVERNDEGEMRRKVSGWVNGEFRELYLKDDLTILKHKQKSVIESGDIIRYTENDGEITAAVVEFMGQTLSQNSGDNLGYFNIRSTDCHYQTGSVYSFEGAWVLLSHTETEDGYSYETKNLVNVKVPDRIAIYNRTSKSIRTGTKDDIKTYRNSGKDASYILIKQYYARSDFAIIFEK
ncbi:MAG: hypothetical protein IJT23_03050 [Clostridia bacterium]|nr:hypothetical protein [Clostridia bacterium]